ncbi:MAG: type II toxin-antitoxin system PemK/MazF family toxin [Bacillota bacterium]
MDPTRGDIYFADLSPVVGSEQGGFRPVLIIQNDIGNRYSPTVIISAITSRITKAHLPTHVELPGHVSGLDKDSVVLLEQIRTIDKRRLKRRIARLDDEIMAKIDEALAISCGLKPI